MVAALRMQPPPVLFTTTSFIATPRTYKPKNCDPSVCFLSNYRSPAFNLSSMRTCALQMDEMLLSAFQMKFKGSASKEVKDLMDDMLK
eukprot:8331411-Pyramimonas_sp.AAC.1